VRYLVPGWPVKVNGHSAATPNLTRMAGGGAQQYKQAVTGQPGTQGIPVEPVVPSADIGDLVLAGTSRSPDAPNVIYPNLYFTGPTNYPGAGMPISRLSDNLMPVPAVDPRGIPSTQYKPVNRRGQRAIQTLPNMPRWS
jgi:hypothetical protein